MATDRHTQWAQRFDLLGDTTRLRLLDRMHHHPGSSVAELAEAAGGLGAVGGGVDVVLVVAHRQLLERPAEHLAVEVLAGRRVAGHPVVPGEAAGLTCLGGGAVLARNMSKLLLICAGAVIFFGLFALSGNENSGSLIGNWLLSSLGFK